MSRLEELLKFVAEDPGDPFNLYALGLEYLKFDREKAHRQFEKLLKEHPRYLPLYYTFGKSLQEKNEKVKALKMFEAGIEIATEEKDFKALRELRNALTEVEYELDQL